MVASLNVPVEASAPVIGIPNEARAAAETLLAEHGHPAGALLVVLAPGAAYGKAKQWTPAHVATLITRLTTERSATCVLVGSSADAAAGAEIKRALASNQSEPSRGPIDLIGRTTLEQLTGILACAEVCVSNDSGAMHLAAAVGARVVATFGPTNENATRPLPRPGRRADVLTHPVWCRPCMLRECPIDHRCMRGLLPDRVFDAVVQ
jgi:heptosyltransferase-2